MLQITNLKPMEGLVTSHFTSTGLLNLYSLQFTVSKRFSSVSLCETKTASELIYLFMKRGNMSQQILTRSTYLYEITTGSNNVHCTRLCSQDKSYFFFKNKIELKAEFYAYPAKVSQITQLSAEKNLKNLCLKSNQK